MKSAPSNNPMTLTRRKFLRTGAASAVLASGAPVRAGAMPLDTLNLAIVGCGYQADTLTRAARYIDSVPFRWVAFCDLLEPRCASFARRLNLDQGQSPSPTYTELETMLEKHPEIDAVFIATPDWLHEPMTVLCLRAGKHVFCEDVMATTVAGAANMVRCQRETGKLLQIDYQCRGNPRYQFSKTELIDQGQLCGRLTHACTQWNRGVLMPWYSKFSTDEVKSIEAAGYANAFELINWRGFRKYSGGPCANLGSRGVDVLNWFLNSPPKSVRSTGGRDYYVNIREKDKPPFSYETLDNLISIYDYEMPGNGLVRAVSQVVTTNSTGARHEKFMGDKGAFTLNDEIILDWESPYNRIYREPYDTDLAKWRSYLAAGKLFRWPKLTHHKFWEREKTWHEAPKWLAEPDPKDGEVLVRESEPLDEYAIQPYWAGPHHTPHIENFLRTIHTKGKQTDLNCPAEAAYATTVAILKAVELAENGGGSYEFLPSEFVVS